MKKAEQEFNKVREYLYNAYGWKLSYSPKGPKVKQHAKLTNDAEKIRIGVRKQISEGIKHIRKSIPSLADHLERYIKTGAQCMYHLDPNHPKWRVEWNS